VTGEENLEKSSEIVYEAVNELKCLPECLTKGLVTVSQLDYYKKHEKELKLLYRIVDCDQTSTFVKVLNAIDLCFTKLTFLKEYRSKLCVVIDYCKIVSKGMIHIMLVNNKYTYLARSS